MGLQCELFSPGTAILLLGAGRISLQVVVCVASFPGTGLRRHSDVTPASQGVKGSQRFVGSFLQGSDCDQGRVNLGSQLLFRFPSRGKGLSWVPDLGFPETAPETAVSAPLKDAESPPLQGSCPVLGPFMHIIPFSPCDKPISGHCYIPFTTWKPQAEMFRSLAQDQ